MKKIVICAASLLLASFVVGPIFAASEEDLIKNDVLLYDPAVCNVEDSSIRSHAIDEELIGLSTLQKKWIDENHGIAQNLSVEFGIPWEAVMAQSIVESTAGTSYFATMRNNFFGLGAYDSNPDNAYYYDNLEAGWRGYFELIQQNYKTYGAKGVFTKETMTDPYKYLEAIKAAGYATDPNYVAKVSNYIDYIVTRSMQLGWLSSAELAESNERMSEHANQNSYSKYNVNYIQNTVLNNDCSCSDSSKSSGTRFNDGWIVGDSVNGFHREEVIGTNREYFLKASDYGMTFKASDKTNGEKKAYKIVVSTISPKDNTIGEISNYSKLYDGYYPHITVDLFSKRTIQHFPINESAAYSKDSNRDGVIYITLVGDFSDSSAWNLGDNNLSALNDYSYASKIVLGVAEQYGITKDEIETANSKLQEIATTNFSDEITKTYKCMTEAAKKSGLEEREMKRIIKHYNSSSVSAEDWNLPLGTKNNDMSLVAYFVQRFTNLGKVDRDWGLPRDVAKKLSDDYPQFSTGTEVKPLAVFSVTDDSIKCGDYSCGHTGIVLGFKDNLVYTIEADYPNTSAKIKKHPISYFENSANGVTFVYLESEINQEEFNVGKQGN